MSAFQLLLETDFPDSELGRPFLDGYFPRLLRERFAAKFEEHVLRREIVATGAVNYLINRGGTLLLPRLEQGARNGIGDAVAAWIEVDREAKAQALRDALLASGRPAAEEQAGTRRDRGRARNGRARAPGREAEARRRQGAPRDRRAAGAVTGSRPPGISAGLCAAFLCSGAAALLFETLWFRLCGLSLGNSIWASSVVLAAFMAGLALGNALAARYGGRVARPLVVFARLETGVAVLSLALVLSLPGFGAWLAPLLAGLPGPTAAAQLQPRRPGVRADPAAREPDGRDAAAADAGARTVERALRNRARSALRLEHARRRPGRARRGDAARPALRARAHGARRGRAQPGGRGGRARARPARRRVDRHRAGAAGGRGARGRALAPRAAARRRLAGGRDPARARGGVVPLPGAVRVRDGARLRPDAGDRARGYRARGAGRRRVAAAPAGSGPRCSRSWPCSRASRP